MQASRSSCYYYQMPLWLFWLTNYCYYFSNCMSCRSSLRSYFQSFQKSWVVKIQLLSFLFPASWAYFLFLLSAIVRSKNSSSSNVSSSFSNLCFLATFVSSSPKMFTLIQSSAFSSASTASTNLFSSFSFFSRSFSSSPNSLFSLLASSFNSPSISSYFLNCVQNSVIRFSAFWSSLGSRLRISGSSWNQFSLRQAYTSYSSDMPQSTPLTYLFAAEPSSFLLRLLALKQGSFSSSWMYWSLSYCLDSSLFFSANSYWNLLSASSAFYRYWSYSSGHLRMQYLLDSPNLIMSKGRTF